MCAAEFDGSVERSDDVATLSLRGEADLAVRDRMQELVDDALATGARKVVVDCSRLDYLESACLRILIQAHAHAADEGRELVVQRASGIVRRVLELAGVAEILIADS
jgi:anti-sigma B factor antagonist